MSEIPAGYVEAEWTGASAVTINGTLVQPGDTWIVSAGEADESANWRPIGITGQPAKPLESPAPEPAPDDEPEE